MLYLANASSPAIRAAIEAGELGMMCTPAEGRSPANARYWAADNGCFGKGYPGDDRWFAWLVKHAEHADRCLFANAPDVFLPELGVGDAAATLRRSAPWLPRIRKLGYPAGLVFQDGIEDLDIPWDSFDVAFIGGSTQWKLDRPAARLIAEAKRRGKRVHMGRVNSGKRHSYATLVGCESVDGTFLTYGPDINLARLRSWQDQHDLFSQTDLPSIEPRLAQHRPRPMRHGNDAVDQHRCVDAQSDHRHTGGPRPSAGALTPGRGGRSVLTSLRRRGGNRQAVGGSHVVNGSASFRLRVNAPGT